MGIDQRKEREGEWKASRRLLQRSRQETGGQELGKHSGTRTKGTNPCDVASSGLTVEKGERRAGTCDFGDLILSKVRIVGERQTRGKR